MSVHTCTCAPTPVHSTPEQCAADRASTAAYLSAVTSSSIAGFVAAGDRLRAEHHAHLTPAHGCPACPLDGRFRRDSAEGEWYVPAG